MSKSKIIRQQIWGRLLDVAKPDTRFHLNFSEVIPDFDGSEAATAKVVAMPEYAACTFAFITPDNCTKAPVSLVASTRSGAVITGTPDTCARCLATRSA